MYSMLVYIDRVSLALRSVDKIVCKVRVNLGFKSVLNVGLHR